MNNVILPSAGDGSSRGDAPQFTCVVELAGEGIASIHGLDRYASAYVTVCLHGAPVGAVNVPIVSGTLTRERILFAAGTGLGPALAREGIRHSLRTTGVPAVFEAKNLLRRESEPLADVPPDVSVAVCTRDRADDLARCLVALTELQPPAREILVIDNAPRTEATRLLVERDFPHCRYVRETKPGLDHARNRALTEARSTVIAFTDDDVMVDRHWVGSIGRIFAEEPAVGAVTGLVLPSELDHPGQALFELYGGFQKGFRRQRFAVDPAAIALPWPWLGTGQFGTGANMAFRRKIFDEIGHFDPVLDVGTPTNGGGDLEIFMRVLKSGWTLLYDPAALVRHRHRRTRAELQRQLTDFGTGFRCYLDRVARNFPEERPGLARLRRWWWREWIIRRGLRALFKPTSTPGEFIRCEVRGYFLARDRYARARRAFMQDGATPPDLFRAGRKPDAAARKDPVRRAGLLLVNAAVPLADLREAGQFDETRVAVHWHGCSCGELTFSNRRRAIPAAELADAIADHLWGALLSPEKEFPAAISWSQAQTSLLAALQLERRIEDRLPASVPVSVIIAKRDRPDDLRRCLSSLRECRAKHPLEIVVVDNHPASGVTAPVLQEFPEVKAVAETRPGLSYARNAGIAAAAGEILIMTDDDVAFPADWFERLLAPFARADILAVTGNVRPASLATRAERLFELYGGLGRGPQRRLFDFRWFEGIARGAVPTWEIGATANAAFRSEVFRQPHIGPLHEALGAGSPTGCSEDTLLFYRILAAGGKIAYEPDAFVWHHHRTSEDALRHQLYSYSKGHVAYHLMTFKLHRDWRGLVRIGWELPRDFLRRGWGIFRMRGRSRYPMRLLVTELAGYLAGPWALWRSLRRVRRLGPGARPNAGVPAAAREPAPAGAENRRMPA